MTSYLYKVTDDQTGSVTSSENEGQDKRDCGEGQGHNYSVNSEFSQCGVHQRNHSHLPSHAKPQFVCFCSSWQALDCQMEVSDRSCYGSDQDESKLCFLGATSQSLILNGDLDDCRFKDRFVNCVTQSWIASMIRGITNLVERSLLLIGCFSSFFLI